MSFDVSMLDMTSLGAPGNTSLSVRAGTPEGAELGTAAVAGGAASVEFDTARLDDDAVWLVAAPSGTRIRVPDDVVGLAQECATAPTPVPPPVEVPAEAPTDEPTGSPAGEPTEEPAPGPEDPADPVGGLWQRIHSWFAQLVQALLDRLR